LKSQLDAVFFARIGTLIAALTVPPKNYSRRPDMTNRPWQLKSLRALLLGVTPLFCLSIPAQAQNSTAQDRAVHDDVTRRDVAEFARFLDSHPELAEQVRKDPSLLDNRQFVHDHPALEAYLQNHPGVRDEIRQNPNAFMHQEDRFDNDATRRDVADFAHFLDSHPELAEQVRKDPSLLDNRQFVHDHPALEAYLQNHPGVRDEIRQNPNAFMREEDRFDNREGAYRGDRDYRNVAEFDHFLDSHREIGEQVRRDPSLLDNRQFVQNHPALETYLRDNPGVRDEIRQNPRAFMQQEDRFDRENADRDHLASFGTFLGGHSTIAKEVSEDPNRLKDQQYVDNHADLKAYLNANPDVRQDLMADPTSFVKGAQQYTSGTPGSGTNDSGNGTAGGGATTKGSNSNGSTGTETTPAPKPKQ
jgi:hypothetical protein